jgi:hypothetical protein
MSDSFLSQEEKDFFKESLLKEKLELVYKLSLSLGLDPDNVTIENTITPVGVSNLVLRSYQSLLSNLQIIQNLRSN